MRLPPLDNFRSPIALACFFLTTIIGLFLDLWTKALAVEHLETTGAVIKFIPGWLHFTYTTNPGAVFGLGKGYLWLFLIVSIFAIAFLTGLFALSGRQRIYQIILGMLLAGVLGNMYDRVMYGHVRDMIHALPRWPNFFPWIFNVADSLLCVGVALMIVYSLFHRPKEDEEVQRQATGEPARRTTPIAVEQNSERT